MTDRTIRQAVTDELAFDPSIDSANIGIAVDEGIVTLTGHVATYAERFAAETATRKVRGVRGVVEEIEVQLVGEKAPHDEDIAHRAVRMLDWNVWVPKGAIQVNVRDGVVTLTGKVEWQYQKTEAHAAVNHLPGILGLVDLIEVAPHASATDVRHKIEAALRRNAQVEAEAIHVDVVGDKVTLTGKVQAWNERGAAERAAWSAPGVRAVEDRIQVA
jgi:osmotically-inducible protein OsmY